MHVYVFRYEQASELYTHTFIYVYILGMNKRVSYVCMHLYMHIFLGIREASELCKHAFIYVYVFRYEVSE